MEFISGQSLYQILKSEGILDEYRVSSYFLKIAEALKVIHEQNLLHRDINALCCQTCRLCGAVARAILCRNVNIWRVHRAC